MEGGRSEIRQRKAVEYKAEWKERKRRKEAEEYQAAL